MIGKRGRIGAARAGWIALLAMFALGFAAKTAPAQASPDVAHNSSSFWFRILVPADLVPSRIGHASFELGSDMVLVFAAHLPVRQSALREVSGIAAATVRHLPDATILRIPLPRGQSIHADPAAGSFHVILGPPKRIDSAMPSFIDGQILFPTTSADQTIAYAPSAATTLLVGTVTSDLALNRTLEGPGYTTISAENGIVIAAHSDEIALVPGQKGFDLHSSVQTLDLPVGNPPVSGAQLAAPRHSSGINLPGGSLVTLRNRIEAAQVRIARERPLDRVSSSYRLARTLISAGLGPEAHGVLTDMLRRDPAAVDDPQRRLLLGISDVVAYRSSGTPLKWPRLPTAAQRADEQLWTGLADAERGDAAAAAGLLSGRLGLLMALPRTLRASFLPLAAETLIAAGSLDSARNLLGAEAHDHALALARAELLQSETHPRQALGAYDALLDNADQRVAGIARFRSIMLRYRLHQITAGVATAALAKHILDWGGDRHALDMRLALAKMAARSGDFPRAFTVLATASHHYPNAAGRILHARQAMFNTMVTSGALARLPILPAVSILKSNADLIPPGAAGIPVLRMLSKRLVTLGLPDQAIPVLQQIVARAPDAASRTHFGLALAKLDLAVGHPKQAQSVLDDTAGSDADHRVAAERTDLSGEIAAQTEPPSGLSPLTSAADPKALALMAKRAEREGDWPLAETTVAKLAATTVAHTGTLDPAGARIIVQWAVAARHTHDDTTLDHLRMAYLSRIPPGRSAALFAAITSRALTPNASLADALAQIKAIEKVGDVVGRASPQSRSSPNTGHVGNAKP